ncbi:hypothetical protein D9M72_494340 [compost metagenome]
MDGDAGHVLPERGGAHVLQSGSRRADEDDAAFDRGANVRRGGFVRENPPGGNVALCRVRRDVEPEFAGRGERHDEVADLDGGERVGDVGCCGEHIGRGALRHAQRLQGEARVELLPVAEEQRCGPHHRGGGAGIEADMAEPGGVGFELGP